MAYTASGPRAVNIKAASGLKVVDTKVASGLKENKWGNKVDLKTHSCYSLPCPTRSGRPRKRRQLVEDAAEKVIKGDGSSGLE